MEISITLLIIIATVLVSITGFSNEKIINDLIFYPPAVSKNNQWYRFFSCGLIHADWGHLIFNMFALYIFGMGQNKTGVEYVFKSVFGNGIGSILYLSMYILALAVCLIPTYGKNKDNYHYRSLGASGAVSAVIFASILFYPTSGMGLMFIPVYVASFIFGAIYLVVSTMLEKRGGDNINHSAHIWGALFGIAFTIVACKLVANFPVVQFFIEQIRNMRPSDFIQFGRSGF